MCLWARRDKTNKTNKKKPHRKTGGWDKCQRFEITLLLPRQRQETRCRDAIWREFVSSSHVQTFPSTSPWIQFLFVWRAVDGGRCVSASSVWGRNPASSRNTNNNPSMFLIRLLFFLLTSAVSRSETIAVTFSVFFCCRLCVFRFATSHIGLENPHEHTLLLPGLVCSWKVFPRWLSCGCRSDQCPVDASLGRCY